MRFCVKFKVAQACVLRHKKLEVRLCRNVVLCPCLDTVQRAHLDKVTAGEYHFSYFNLYLLNLNRGTTNLGTRTAHWRKPAQTPEYDRLEIPSSLRPLARLLVQSAAGMAFARWRWDERASFSPLLVLNRSILSRTLYGEAMQFALSSRLCPSCFSRRKTLFG